MSLGHYGVSDPKPHPRSHSHNLSVHSILSLSEPTTPPPVAAATKSYLWDSHKLNTGVVLPLFNLGDHPRQLPNDQLSLGELESLSSWNSHYNSAKFDKEYLASIAKIPLSQLVQEIPRLAKDQYGCRFLQKRIDQSIVTNSQTRKANFRIIFTEVLDLFCELIMDPFGNYLVQRLTDYCTEADLDFIMETLSTELYLISVNQHGTRALQKIIEKMNTDLQLAYLMKGLSPYIIELIKDLNGNHVIQKILNKYPPEKCQFIYDSIIGNLLVVATHKHGCCVLQKCLNHVNASQLTAFADSILHYDTFSRLVNDQFGNYVLQYLISINSIEVDCRLFQNLMRIGVSELCNLKFSSNVIEKLMKNCYTNEPVRREFSELKFTIIALILTADINKFINDPYGNYVAQTLIDVLINTKVNYITETPDGTQQIMPGLQILLGNEDLGQQNSGLLQSQVIRRWFANCKIVSSFGKRIQSKIATILNGNPNPYTHRRSAPPQANQFLGGPYNHHSYGYSSKNEMNGARNFNTGSLHGPHLRTYPLLDVTARNNFNYRAQPPYGQNMMNSQFTGPTHSHSNFIQNALPMNKATAQTRPLESISSSYVPGTTTFSPDYHVTSPTVSRGLNSVPYNTIGNQISSCDQGTILPLETIAKSRTPSFVDNENLVSSTSNLSLNGPTFGANYKPNHSVPGQNLYKSHGRSASYNAINLASPW